MNKPSLSLKLLILGLFNKWLEPKQKDIYIYMCVCIFVNNMAQ